MSEYYGQLKQDLECLEYFKNKKDGFFVDIGAGNGKDLSNTYLLEKNFGWKGMEKVICIQESQKKLNTTNLELILILIRSFCQQQP